MSLRRSPFLSLAAGAVLLPSTVRLGWAQGYPTWPRPYAAEGLE
jgi:hypothetical protein